MWLKSWALLLLADGKEEDTATLVLPIAQCVLCVHCTAPPPPLVPLLGHGGDLQPAAFIHRYTTRARPGTAHLYRLALCLKQGFW